MSPCVYTASNYPDLRRVRICSLSHQFAQHNTLKYGKYLLSVNVLRMSASRKLGYRHKELFVTGSTSMCCNQTLYFLCCAVSLAKWPPLHPEIKWTISPNEIARHPDFLLLFISTQCWTWFQRHCLECVCVDDLRDVFTWSNLTSVNFHLSSDWLIVVPGVVPVNNTLWQLCGLVTSKWFCLELIHFEKFFLITCLYLSTKSVFMYFQSSHTFSVLNCDRFTYRFMCWFVCCWMYWLM